jgi:hypothetical protein
LANQKRYDNGQLKEQSNFIDNTYKDWKMAEILKDGSKKNWKQILKKVTF